MNQDARTRSPWEYPVCLKCQTNVLVASSKSALYDYICYGCGRRFTAEGTGGD